MCVIPQLIEKWRLDQLQSAAAIYLREAMGFSYTPTELSQSREVARSTIYRQAWELLLSLEQLPSLKRECQQLRQHNARLQRELQQLQSSSSQQKSGIPVWVTAERVAMTALEMASRGCSTEDIKATLRVAFSPLKPPSDGTLNAIIKRASWLAEQIQDQAPNIYPLMAVEFDELYHAREPVLMMIEPYSMAILLLEQLGNSKAHTWKFAMEYRGVEPPFLMAHDCSAQGNLLVRLFGLDSQLCVFHRLREIRRELRPFLDKTYKKALEECDELLWDLADWMEKSLALLTQCTSVLDFKRGQVRRLQPSLQEFYTLHEETMECLQMLQERADLGEWNIPSLKGWPVREEQFFNNLKRWERLAAEVVWKDGQEGNGFAFLDALAAVYCGGRALESAFEYGSEEEYWRQQSLYLQACENLRQLQAICINPGKLAKEFAQMVEYEVRTTSRIEAVNRRLRDFTDAKRHVTDRQLRLMQLHHNTTPFTADAKRAGQSPWQILGLDVPGLEDGFIGVIREANGGEPWPSTWELKLAS